MNQNQDFKLLHELRVSGNKEKGMCVGRRIVKFLLVGTSAAIWFESKVLDNVPATVIPVTSSVFI